MLIISDEMSNISPALTNRDAAAAVLRPRRMMGLGTSRHHRKPRGIKPVLRHAMLSRASRTQLIPQASAGCAGAAHKTPSHYQSFRPAGAPAEPLRLPAKTIWMMSNDHPSSESLPRQINVSHGDPITSVDCGYKLQEQLSTRT
jgi:hypothetical protein